MPNHLCWLCKARTGHEPIGDAAIINELQAGISLAAGLILVSSAYRCASCNAVSVANIITPNANRGNTNSVRRGQDDTAFDWRPNALESKTYPDVPEHIANAATEAYECHSAQHYRAAILLSRSVIEATAKDKGITDGVLFSKIEALEQQNFIRPHIKAVAHGIRDYGNDMAHGDFVEPVEAEESKLVVQLMGEILDEVYQSPARLAAVQQAVEERRQNRPN